MKILKISLLLAVAFGAFFFGARYQKNKPKAGDLANAAKEKVRGGVTVRVTRPDSRDMFEIVRATGNLEAIDKVDVYSKLPGEIVEVNVEEGDTVEDGQLLAALDDEEYRLKLDQARANYSQAVVNYNSLKATNERNKSLYDEELISDQQYEQVEAQYKVARNQVRSANVLVKEARLTLSYTKIKAPMAGVITAKDCEDHQRITSAERLFEISDLDPLQVRVRVTEGEVQAVKNTQRPVKLTIEALRNTNYNDVVEGKISFISPVVDSSSGTTEVRVEVTNESGLLTAGMFTRVAIETRLHEEAKVIPKQALLGEEGAYYVFVVKPDERGRPRAHRVDVTTGLMDDLYTELTGDEIADSDWVVTEGQNLLGEGDLVEFASSEDGTPPPEGFTLDPEDEGEEPDTDPFTP